MRPDLALANAVADWFKQWNERTDHRMEVVFRRATGFEQPSHGGLLKVPDAVPLPDIASEEMRREYAKVEALLKDLGHAAFLQARVDDWTEVPNIKAIAQEIKWAKTRLVRACENLNFEDANAATREDSHVGATEAEPDPTNGRGGFRQIEIVEHVKKKVGSFSDATFRRIRKAADIPKSLSGGAGSKRLYGPEGIIKMAEVTKNASDTKNRAAIAQALREML